MSTKRPSVTTLSDLIQKYTGSDYDKLLEIYENLDEIVRNSGLTLGVDYSENGFTQDNLDDLLRELTATVNQNATSISSIADINAAIALNLQSITGIIDTNTSIDNDVKNAIWAIDEDGMESNTELKVPTQQSVKAFVLNTLANSQGFKGDYDASANVPQLDNSEDPITPGEIKKADSWTVSVAGNFFGNAVGQGDKLQALIDDPLAVTDWVVTPNALDAASIAALYEGYNDTLDPLTAVRRFTEFNFQKLAGMELNATADQDAIDVPFIYPVDGAVTEAVISTGGVNYEVNDVLDATSGSGTGLEITVTSVDGLSGEILDFFISNRGQDYLDTDTGISFSGGAGTLATFNVTAVSVAQAGYTPPDVQRALDGILELIQRIDVDTLDGSLYTKDPSRDDKLLSVAELQYVFSKELNASSVYLSPGNIITTTGGITLPKDATLIGIHAEGEGNLSKEFELRLNGSSVFPFLLSGGVFSDMALDYNFDEGDKAQVWVTQFDDDVINPIVTLYFKWRK
jgi:hypothetical protein